MARLVNSVTGVVLVVDDATAATLGSDWKADAEAPADPADKAKAAPKQPAK